MSGVEDHSPTEFPQSILRHAFTGQLVSQDPNDEPASELLKRIAAERKAHEELAREVKTARAKISATTANRGRKKPKP